MSYKDKEILETLDIIGGQEKIIKIARLSLWNYRGGFVFSGICVALTIFLLFFVNENNIVDWAGDGETGILAPFRYKMCDLLLNYVNEWWFYLIKLSPLVLVYNTISNLILGYASLKLVLTEKRIIIISGFVSNDIIDYKIDNVESLRTHKDMSGMIYKYGDITIIGVGNSTTVLQGIKKPEEFKKAFDRLKY